MNLEGILLSKISQTEEDKYCMLYIICGIKKKMKNERIIVTEQMSGSGRVGCGESRCRR